MHKRSTKFDEYKNVTINKHHNKLEKNFKKEKKERIKIYTKN